jgi:Flp pilus assembly protein TadG
VEFALLLPLVLLILFGIIDFGWALNAQITLTQAAREGARVAALKGPDVDVERRTQLAATELLRRGVVIVSVDHHCPTPQSNTEDAVVKTSYSYQFVTPVGALAGFFGGGGFGSPITLTATGVMPCER